MTNRKAGRSPATIPRIDTAGAYTISFKPFKMADAHALAKSADLDLPPPGKLRRMMAELNKRIRWYPTYCLADGAPPSERAHYADGIGKAAGDLLLALGLGADGFDNRASDAAEVLVRVGAADAYGRARSDDAFNAHVADYIVDRESREILHEEGHQYEIAGDPCRALVHAMRGVVFLQTMALKAASRHRAASRGRPDLSAREVVVKAAAVAFEIGFGRRATVRRDYDAEIPIETTAQFQRFAIEAANIVSARIPPHLASLGRGMTANLKDLSPLAVAQLLRAIKKREAESAKRKAEAAKRKQERDARTENPLPGVRIYAP